MQSAESRRSAVDAIIETMEVFIHSLLFIRRVYPSEIFRPRKFYSIPARVSIFPPVNEYIQSVLKTAKFLLTQEKLSRLDLVLISGTYSETYCFEVSEVLQKGDPYGFEFEELVKKALLTAEEMLQGLPRLQTDARFKVLVHTSRSAYCSLSDSAGLCDLQWFRAEPPNEAEEVLKLLPVAEIKNVGLQVYCVT